jgi:hypothetical protein
MHARGPHNPHRSETEIQILTEEERPGGLAFRASVREGAAERIIEIRLHWADYNLWSPDGVHPPQSVAMAVARYLVGRAGAEALPESIDASTPRRRDPDADAAIVALLHDPGSKTRSRSGGSDA